MSTFSDSIISGCRDKATDKSTLSANGSSRCVVVAVVAYPRQQHLLEHKGPHQTYVLITACEAGRVFLDTATDAKDESANVLVVHVEFPAGQPFVRRGRETALYTCLDL